MIEKIYEIKENIFSYKYYIIGIFIFIFILLGLYFNINNSDNNSSNLTYLEEKNEVKDKCMVDIKGYINNPGLYELECDKRINDVVKLAGGLMDNSDTSVINLSKKISDGMVIVIYSKDEVLSFKEVKELEQKNEEKCKNTSIVVNDACITKTERVDNDKRVVTNDNTSTNINTNKGTNTTTYEVKEEIDNTPKIISINNASKEELMTLKGIGESKALAIISYREEHGPFTSIEDIKNIKGIGEKMFEKIKDFITL